MTTGIYKLVFKGTNKVYIGKSIHLETRLNSHIQHFKSGTAAKKLSEAFISYGVPELVVLLECDEVDLSESENTAIEIYNSVIDGFNTLSNSDEIPTPDNSGELNGLSKCSNEIIEQIFFELIKENNGSLHSIANKLNVSYSIVSSISSCRNHKWLLKKYPDQYSILLSKVGTRNRGKSAIDRGIIYPIIISPEGTEYTINNIRQFAIANKLDRGCLHKVLTGKITSTKGWKLKTLE